MSDNKVLIENQTQEIQPKKMLGLKIFAIIFYLLATTFVVSFVPDIVKNINGTNADKFGASIGLVIMLVYGSLSYVPSLLFSLIGVVVSAIRYKNKVIKKATMLFFIITLLLEVFSVLGIYLFTILIQ